MITGKCAPARSPLRVAMFGHKRVPGREGGIEVVVEELGSRLVERGCVVTCYNRKGNCMAQSGFDYSLCRQYRGMRIKRVTTIDRKGLAAVTSSLFAAIRAGLGRYDIVHIHAEGPAAMCWLPKIMGKKVVVSIHGLDHARAKWGRFASAYIMAGERNAVKFADEIIVLSSNAQAYFWDTYHRKTTLIPNGVIRPHLAAPTEIGERWGLEKDSYILYLGRLVPEKGIQFLLAAWKDITTGKKLVIAGSSSDTQQFADELRKMAGDNVIFTGFVQGNALEELYSNAYVYVLPSMLEGMPLSLMEAMSYGNCCLTSDIGECAGVIEDKGVLFENKNVDDLRMKLEQLLEHPEVVKKYKSDAAEYICSKYSWDDVARQTVQLYRGEE